MNGCLLVTVLPSSFHPTLTDVQFGASDHNIEPLPDPVEGDLWFDSDQLALYVAAKDELDDLRWVITTPADRSVLQDEVDIPDLPIPSSPHPSKAGGGDPFDGMTVYNDPSQNSGTPTTPTRTSGLTCPRASTNCHYTAFLVRGADDFDETFEYNQADRDRLGDECTLLRQCRRPR